MNLFDAPVPQNLAAVLVAIVVTIGGIIVALLNGRAARRAKESPPATPAANASDIQLLLLVQEVLHVVKDVRHRAGLLLSASQAAAERGATRDAILNEMREELNEARATLDRFLS